MGEEKGAADNFMGMDKFISELIGFHEQIKQLRASEANYRHRVETLQESLNQYQVILDHLPPKIFLKDKNFRYLFANENYARFLGVAPREVVGKTDQDFFPFKTAEQNLNEEREVMEKGVPAEKGESHTHEGRARVERMVKSPVKDASGETVGILGISWDLTDQRAREEELEKRSAELCRLFEARTSEWKEIQGKFQSQEAEFRQLEEMYKNLEGLFRILFENTGTAIAVIDDNRVISRVNAEFEKISGYSRAEVEGAKNWDQFLPQGRPEKAGESTPYPDPFTPVQGAQVFQFMDKENKRKTVSMTTARIPISNKVLISLIDITKHSQAREDLDRIMRQFTEFAVEMKKGIGNLGG